MQATGNKVCDYLDMAGALWRVAFPALILLGATVISGKIDNINNRLEKMDSHFTNHLQHHQDLEVGYERRLSNVEKQVEVNTKKWDNAERRNAR